MRRSISSTGRSDQRTSCAGLILAALAILMMIAPSLAIAHDRGESGKSGRRKIGIEVLSSPPDLVSGGDARIRISLP
ncbi:MAG TPA: hypothetical protein ENI85_12255, partial [Deltaproteobacteria bacterium]|nr:hypothetical protein [Deltaproteobacteria bacterium]